MTKAFECDRCGELYGEPPALKVGTSGLEECGGRVELEKREDKSRQLGGLGGVAPPEVSAAGYDIKGGDLCEACAAAFRDFWGGDGE